MMPKRKYQLECYPRGYGKKEIDRLRAENAKLKKQLEDMDLQKLAKEVEEHFKTEGEINIKRLFKMNCSAIEIECRIFYMSLKRANIQAEGNTLPEAIANFRKKLGEMK